MTFNEYEEDVQLSYEYIAGLLDAVGNIYVDYRKTTNNKMYGIVRVSIAQKFPNILYNIRSYIGMGSLNYNKSGSWIYELTGNEAIDFLTKISDFLVVKHEQVINAINFVKEGSIEYSEEKIKLARGLNTKLRFVLTNIHNFNIKWFAGYFDGDGCLSVSKQDKTTKPRFRMEITIDKREESFSNFLIKNIGGKKYFCENIKYQIQPHDFNMIDEFINNLHIKKSQFVKYKQWIKKYPLYKCCNINCKESDDFINEIKLLKQKETVELKSNIQVDFYQKFTRTTAKYPKENALEYLALGLTSEAGEVAGKIKKILRQDYDLSEDVKKQILLEVSDCLWYCARICDELNYKLSDVMWDNINKLTDRKERNKIKGEGDNR